MHTPTLWDHSKLQQYQLIIIIDFYLRNLAYNWNPRHAYGFLNIHWVSITQFVFIWLPRLVIWIQIGGCGVKVISYLYASNIQGTYMVIQFLNLMQEYYPK